ncbi:MAG: hypothetical protein A2498_15595 [Lentisphaerae bacterium RIFOXYC12_FULL_60_16]|nr:MAG: hypothetical protein A2498_15595 [Lentisphaerae bacterium RIFOXYC12_FULL_60_16]OGV73717.1 MAG: hypothetical protein A2269_04460 [Lentisphaerae bacterium RIFOXYA12_FULL_60_10]OGV79339.1 MAG: hypothetical protein A2340_04850 [Lentisphaerae bacterium RIFOXYB12_FULL_60_10]
MHELSIAQILVEQVVAAARKAGATRVIQVSVALGNLGTVNPDALAAAFPIAAEHTFIAGTTLSIRRVPVRCDCKACGMTTEPEFPFQTCGACGSGNVTVLNGHELLLEAIELDVPVN